MPENAANGLERRRSIRLDAGGGGSVAFRRSGTKPSPTVRSRISQTRAAVLPIARSNLQTVALIKSCFLHHLEMPNEGAACRWAFVDGSPRGHSRNCCVLCLGGDLVPQEAQGRLVFLDLGETPDRIEEGIVGSVVVDLADLAD